MPEQLEQAYHWTGDRWDILQLSRPEEQCPGRERSGSDRLSGFRSFAQGAFQFSGLSPWTGQQPGYHYRSVQATDLAGTVSRETRQCHTHLVSAGTSTETCTTCTSSTVVKEGVCSVCPYPSGCPSANSVSMTAPAETPPDKSHKVVYPRPSTCKWQREFMCRPVLETCNRCRRILWRMVAPWSQE